MDGEKDIIFVGMADIKVASSPSILRTNLGSCIAVCLYHAGKEIGGMLHFMLADSFDAAKTGREVKRNKFADTGLMDLIGLLERNFEIAVTELTAKIFGGARILKMCSLDIGKKNEESAINLLVKNNIKILASKTGGESGYKIDFNLKTGKVICQTFGSKEEEY